MGKKKDCLSGTNHAMFASGDQRVPISNLFFSFMPFIIKHLTPYPSIYRVTYPFRESILSIIFWKTYDVLAQFNCGEKNIKKMHLCQSLTLSYLLFSGGNEYFSYRSEIAVEGKNSKDISLGEQEECINVIYFKATVVRKQKPFCVSNVSIDTIVIDANISIFVTCIYVLAHLWFLHARNNAIALNVSKVEGFF